MKEWFKYEFGFVNIDSDNIYLNNTGNWSEINKLKEKSPDTSQTKSWRKIRMAAYLFICLALFFLIIMLKLLSGSEGIILLVGLIFAGYSLYQYIRPELGAQFRIPIHKIKNIQIELNAVYIEFENIENQLEKIHLEGVEDKGIQLLMKLLL